VGGGDGGVILGVWVCLVFVWCWVLWGGDWFVFVGFCGWFVMAACGVDGGVRVGYWGRC